MAAALAFGLATTGAAELSAAPAPDGPASAPEVQVTRFQVDGNSLLPADVVDEVLRPFVGPADTTRLERAAAALQQRYAQAGFGGVLAYLPPQGLSDGLVRIQVLEGRLAAIEVRGANQPDIDQVLHMLPALLIGATPRVATLDRQIQMANENPSRHVDVVLRPGAAAGEIQAVVTVEARSPLLGQVTIDNTGNSRTGRERLSGTVQHADLTGQGDVLTVMGMTSISHPSQVKVLSGAYRWPFAAQLAFLDAYASVSEVDGGTTSTVAGDLSFAGQGRVLGLRVTRLLPRWGESDQRIGVALDQRAYLNQCAIEGLPDGACGPAGVSVAVQPLSIDYRLQTLSPAAITVDVNLQQNLGLGGSHGGAADFDAARAGARVRYALLRGDAALRVPFAEDWDLSVRLSGQWTSDRLVSAEQFGLGGARSVRGYAEREVAGDRGAFGSVEVASPPLGIPEGMVVWRVSAFVDAGQVTMSDGIECAAGRTRCSLLSVGMALRASAGPVQAQVDVGRAMRDGADTRRHETGVHASISRAF